MKRGSDGIVAELGAEAADVDGDGAGVVEEGVVPDGFHQLVARVDLAGMGGEVGEQVELALGQRELLAVEETRRIAGSIRSGPTLDRRRRLLGRRRDPAQHRVDPGDQFGRREGLDDVVVGAVAQADQAVGLLAAGGQQDHRDPRPGPLVQLPHHLDPVDPRQHQVEHDQVGAVPRRRAAAPRGRRRPRWVS